MSDAPAGDTANGTTPDLSQYVTKADLEKSLGNIVNAAVGSHIKRLDFGKLLAPVLEKSLEPLKALLPQAPAEGEGEGDEDTTAVTEPGTTAQPQGKAKPKPSAQPGATAQPDPVVAELQKKLAKMEDQLKVTAKERERERRNAIEEKAFGSLRAAFGDKLASGAIGLGIDVLRARNRVVIGDDGSVKLKVKAPLEKGLPPEDRELPLDEALPHLLEESEFTFLRPPPSGAGARDNKRPPLAPPSKAPPTRTTSSVNVDDLDESFRARTGQSLDEALLG